MDNIFDLQNLTVESARVLNPQVLAFIGDAVYTMFVRNLIVINKTGKSGELHKLTTRFVKAKTQSAILDKLIPEFNEDEMSVFKRGRNYKTASTAKNSTVQEYHRATGFEAVMGFLYISGQIERLNYFLKMTVGEE